MVLGLLCAAPVFAADLLQIYRAALANDQQYDAARIRCAARETASRACPTLLPTIGATANTLWNQNKYDATNAFDDQAGLQHQHL